MFELNRKHKKERGRRKPKMKTFSPTFIQETGWFHDIIQWGKEPIIYHESIRAIQKWQQAFKPRTFKKY